jgi:macrolide transport system ATP-binding/permease protein
MLRRLRYWLNFSRRADALAEEMRLHLAECAEQLEQDGMPHDLAWAEARRRFGNATLLHEESREIWLTRFLSDLMGDLRYGLRNIVAHKAFSALAVLSLALGIGANTAIYSFMESILLRSLPVADPAALTVVNWQSPPPFDATKQWAHVMHSIQGIAWPADKGMMNSGMFPYAAFELLNAPDSPFTTVFGYFNGHNHNLTVNQLTLSTPTEYVTGTYFSGLGVTPAAGRLIESSDDRPAATPVAVLSYAASQRRFGSAAAAIGQSVFIDKVPFTIIGVAPPQFFGVDPAAAPDLFLPLHTNLLIEGPAVQPFYTDPNSYWLEIMGRLRPGVTLAQAQASLAPRFNQWVAGTASTAGERARLPRLLLNPGAAGLGSLRREYSRPLYVLLGMVGLILAITCTNIANLLLARASSRRREMAVRLSLGAGRFRVIRQLLTESVLLSTLGGACGILFAIWGINSLTWLFSRGREGFTLHAGLNWPVLAATALLSILCGLLFGLVPALESTRPDLMLTLKNTRGSSSQPRLQQVLVIAQVAMSFVILAAAGLFVRTLDHLHSLNLGYTRDNILLLTTNALQAGHPAAELPTFYSNLRQRFESIPGVAAATLSHSSILKAGQAGSTYRGAIKHGAITIDGAQVLTTGPRFLHTMQIPLLAGREFDERDQPTSNPVALISEQLARTYFPDTNPIGRRLNFIGENRTYEIVGVTANFRHGSLKQANSLSVLVPATQAKLEAATYALRTNGDPLAYVAGLREIVRNIDPSLALTNIVTQSTEIDRSINREITFARLCTGFALLALLTACIGLYGTMSYMVSRQVNEIGVRMALGAARRTVLWMVMRRVVVITAIGLALSIPAALIAFRYVKSLLYGVQPNDPATLTVAAILLAATALLAGYLPARRAAAIDPLVALRHD